MHEGMEVGVLLEGEFDVSFDNYHLAARPGDFWLTGMWEPHAHGTRPPLVRTGKLVVVIFLPEFLGDELLGDMPWLGLFSVPAAERPRITTPELREMALAVGRDLRQEIAQERSGWSSMVRLDLLRLLLAVSREWRPANPRQVDAGSLSLVMPALAMAHSMPPRRVTARDAAAACGFSRSRFDSLFLNATGLRFGRFLMRSRLAYVAQQLLRTKRSVAAIGEASGFADPSHLHRSFLRHYSCTPAHYREHGHQLPTSSYNERELTATSSRAEPGQTKRRKLRRTATKRR
jgi:AraC-like DNA-binding protein